MVAETLAARFWSKVNIREGCWEWTACCDPCGYGRFGDWNNGRTVTFKASRIAYESVYGSIPTGLYGLHTCDNPPCVRPDHIYPGTQLDNMADMAVRGRTAKRGGNSQNVAKLSPGDVRAIRARYEAGGCTTRSLGREYGVSGNQISNIVRRVSWSHVA